jgi:hypothetical protein
MDSKKFWIVLAVIIVGFFGFVMFNKSDKDSAGCQAPNIINSQSILELA